MFSFLSTPAAKHTPTPGRLMPPLRDASNKKIRHFLTSLYPGDQLHTTSKVLGFARATRLPVYGFCAQIDADGHPYQLLAYVRPLSPSQPGVVAYANREAVRFPAQYQREQWFGAHLLYLLEIDLTEYADCLRLERLSERVLPLLPAATVVPLPYRQAA